MNIKQLFGLERRPFPDQGVYKGVKYRIDGDAVILRCSNGKDFLMSPYPGLSVAELDRIRDIAIHKRGTDTGLLPWLEIEEQMRLQQFKQLQAQASQTRQVNASSLQSSVFDSAAHFNISLDEYNKLTQIGPQIMIRYWRSKSKPKK